MPQTKQFPGGVHVPSLTFFKDDPVQEIDWEVQDKHFGYLIDAGVHGSMFISPILYNIISYSGDMLTTKSNNRRLKRRSRSPIHDRKNNPHPTRPRRLPIRQYKNKTDHNPRPHRPNNPPSDRRSARGRIRRRRLRHGPHTKLLPFRHGLGRDNLLLQGGS